MVFRNRSSLNVDPRLVSVAVPKMSRLPIHFLLLHICSFALVHSSGVLIKSGVVKNQGEAQNENVEDVKFHKGIANFEEEEGFNKDDEKKSVVAQDSGR